ncbi:hypothetical protein BS330_29010 [Amycolatopsis keratiniphila subsp. nogabecina]|uniref:hypothetical protein n=2 Tax=Amycolatopsis keratiniphila TaxID=129921 RepID=UPI000879820C|nr:hypothetical protein [Amycolatopsis keratiniphila]OLZ50305.1 hypothetical protein BS330_29010 [Amycolatopsis keratiniphila subsp. nogabecina]SDU67209.1 hypothetical protein SAMN04489733_8083 [Amycolatopsis keratiniphila]
MLILDLTYVNFDLGGAEHDQSTVYVMDALVELLGADGRTPDAGIIGEANFWRFFGGKGTGQAEVALNTTFRDRSYVILPGSLPNEWGDLAPALLYDAAKVHRHEWHSGREPGFLERNRNRALLSPRDSPDQKFNLFGFHGHPDGDQRRHDVTPFRPYGAQAATPTVVLGDWFGHPSGPRFEPDTYPEHFDELCHYAPRMLFPDGIPVPGDHPFDTRALDYLCGRWRPGRRDWRHAWRRRKPGRRVGGVGFSHAGELANDYTPTNFPAPNGRPPTQIDAAVLNPRAAAMLVPGSVLIHEPEKPANSHKRISLQLEFPDMSTVDSDRAGVAA